ncbi:30S ribosomal protein S20 [Candidatus Moranella endobia PCVAL]|uniref:Small ribosomal subunit protein bS20 n=1 Tax=Moranella endobia (strain PCIT) TaxID=903503 RepID=F7XXB8_MOREP|nr:30S ribosomal protein S20 [Candidatus Moranella endobia]AEI74744.1 30S ribosomal protein S20 [Candidatus Moranella endobia PCIT]AGJ61400.1 30S ribosomal protein S20 [Candidatus Moranella endobia PCVAL]
MANIKSSKKRAVQSENRRQHNTSRRSMMRTFVKRVYVAIAAGNKTAANNSFCTMQKIIDHQASKGLIHKNKAARQKSKLAIKLKVMSSIPQTK